MIELEYVIVMWLIHYDCISIINQLKLLMGMILINKSRMRLLV